MFWYMEEGSSPKIADQSLGNNGASPFTNTSTTSEKLWTPQAHAGDEGGESPLGAVDVKHPSPSRDSWNGLGTASSSGTDRGATET